MNERHQELQRRKSRPPGDPTVALSQASKSFEATYRFPFQLHGVISKDKRATETLLAAARKAGWQEAPFARRCWK
ncbi:MAG: hypothetical protein ACREQW_09470 [Candidatus Binatia bacterium]